jgi:hypothetical protein
MKLATASDELKLNVPTVTSAMHHLAKLGITRETTGRNYGRIPDLVSPRSRAKRPGSAGILAASSVFIDALT